MDNGQQKKASTVTSQKDNISSSNSRSYTDGCSTVSQPPPPKNLLLTRGFSRVQANEDILAETRNRIESNLVSSIKEPVSNSNNNSASSSVHILNELAYFSFALPNLNRYDDDYKFKGSQLHFFFTFYQINVQLTFKKVFSNFNFRDIFLCIHKFVQVLNLLKM